MFTDSILPSPSSSTEYFHMAVYQGALIMKHRISSLQLIIRNGSTSSKAINI